MTPETAGPERAGPFKRLAMVAHSVLPDRVTEQQDREAVLRLRAALGQRRTLQSRAPWMMVAATCAMAAAIVLWVTLRRDPRLSYTINGQARSGHDYVQAIGAPTTLSFSDGTEVEFDRDAHGRVTETTSTGAMVSIESGTAHISVVKRPKTHWSFAAGPFSIKVSGTKFDVAWSPARETLEVRMLEGTVVVTGPMTGEGVNLDSGHRLSAQVREGWIRIDREGPNGEVAVVQDSTGSVRPAESTELPLGDALPVPSPSAAESKALAAGGASARPTWSKRISAGESASVLEEAERLGIMRTLADASSADVAALADAARYAHRTDLSRRALLAQRARFAGSAAARDAAFLLGRLADDNGSDTRDAVHWYDIYLSEAGWGLYASEALGRKMTALGRVGGPEKARPVAQEYLRRFPTGPYASAARSLVGQP